MYNLCQFRINFSPLNLEKAIKILKVALFALAVLPTAAQAQSMELRANDPRVAVDERWVIVTPNQNHNLGAVKVLAIKETCRALTQQLDDTVVADLYLKCLRKKAAADGLDIIDLKNPSEVARRF